MKVNAIGIENYRQAMDNTRVQNQPATESKKQAEKTDRIEIPGQRQKVGSDLSVRLRPGSFADMLSNEEKQAFELVFQKFNGLRAGEGVYAKNGGTNESHLGNYLDVKL